MSKVERLVDTGDSESVEATALARTVREEFASHALESTALPDDLQGIVMGIEDPSRLTDLVAANLRLALEKKQSILESLDVVQRLRMVEEELHRSREGPGEPCREELSHLRNTHKCNASQARCQRGAAEPWK